MRTNKKQFTPGTIVFHKTDLQGNFPMVISEEIPEHEDPENPEEIHVSYISKTGHIKNAVLSGHSIRYGVGL
jgi:hypothetical protein